MNYFYEILICIRIGLKSTLDHIDVHLINIFEKFDETRWLFVHISKHIFRNLTVSTESST